MFLLIGLLRVVLSIRETFDFERIVAIWDTRPRIHSGSPTENTGHTQTVLCLCEQIEKVISINNYSMLSITCVAGELIKHQPYSVGRLSGY